MLNPGACCFTWRGRLRSEGLGGQGTGGGWEPQVDLCGRQINVGRPKGYIEAEAAPPPPAIGAAAVRSSPPPPSPLPRAFTAVCEFQAASGDLLVHLAAHSGGCRSAGLGGLSAPASQTGPARVELTDAHKTRLGAYAFGSMPPNPVLSVRMFMTGRWRRPLLLAT